MYKIKVRTPQYSFVAADMSGAEVRTSANASGDEQMMDAYRAFNYEKQFQKSIELYSYEMLKTTNGYKTLYIINENDVLLDDDNNQIHILKKEDKGDKFNLILSDNNTHTFTVNKPGQDLYSLIASKIYKNKYEDNLEFYPAGTKIIYEGKEIVCGLKTNTNKAGKTRRQDSKSVLIGLIYGRGAQSIADQINEKRLEKKQPTITKEEAQELIDGIYESFPRLKQWMEETHDFIHKNGYIDDCFGRRRRLPDGMLPKYSITTSITSGSEGFNPLLGCSNRIDNSLVEKYRKKIEGKGNFLSNKDYEEIKKQAKAEGVEIHNNNGFIAQAERQSVNFQSQAASSEVNKLSLIVISKNQELKELGFQPLLTIHDEVIGQCPSENAKRVAEIIPQIMVDVGKEKIKCPMVSEASIFSHWYEDDLTTYINEVYSDRIKKGEDPEVVINDIIQDHTELTPEQIRGVLSGEINGLWNGLAD